MNSGTESGDSFKKTAFLSLAALGIVYGDIGTSPLYAIRECFHGPHSVPLNQGNVFGVLSLIFWSLLLVISAKYLLYVIRADNRGEGGILALMALVRSTSPAGRAFVTGIGLFGAALLYGDGMLTPAISVLSAVEGLEVATPLFAPYVVPITVGILAGLFLLQKRGTAGIGALFGPIMILWFAVLALLGILGLSLNPGVIAAVNPVYAVRFFLENGIPGYLVLGSVFLVVTGGEALYADLGHFGSLPIRISWFALAGPALSLNYFGQGALLLSDPSAAVNPFYNLAPIWAIYPLVALATAATVIASQAVITGVFSLTQQAMQLGFAPRVGVIHTAADAAGQIYVPAANWGLFVATVSLVFLFGSSSAIAAAYGIAVSITMMITTLLAFRVAVQRWRWPMWAAAALSALWLVFDVAFLGANMAKFHEGGWIPVVIALTIALVMSTWKKGRVALREVERHTSYPLTKFIEEVSRRPEVRIPGQAVVLSREAETTPSALLHNFKHNRVVHQRVFVVTLNVEEVPAVPDEERCVSQDLGAGFSAVTLHYGFMETPDVMADLYRANEKGLDVEPLTASYLVSRNTVLAGPYSGMARWRIGLFRLLTNNAMRMSLFLRLPPDRVIEIGRRVQL